MLHKLVFVIVRILLATVVAGIIMILPPPVSAPQWLVNVQVPVTVFLLVCYIGKLLYDTLFFDHYIP